MVVATYAAVGREGKMAINECRLGLGLVDE